VNEEEARAALKEARETRLRQCMEEVNEVLARHKCRLVATPQITEDGRIVAPVGIVPVE